MPPSLAIDVVKTSGGLPKLAVYAGLDVHEVWFWEQGRIAMFLLQPPGDAAGVDHHGYRQVPRSELLPQVDVELLAELVARGGSQLAAVRELRRRVRGDQ